MFTGHQGLGLKLIDQLGNERTAIAWLAKEKGIAANMPVRDYKLEPRFGDLPSCTWRRPPCCSAIGLEAVARRLEGSSALQAVERLNLDGLLALWHPPVAQ